MRDYELISIENLARVLRRDRLEKNAVLSPSPLIGRDAERVRPLNYNQDTGCGGQFFGNRNLGVVWSCGNRQRHS